MRALGGKLLGTGGPWSLEMQERVSLGPYSQRCLGPCRCRKSESACVFSSVVTVSHFWGHVEISVTLEPGSARVGLSQLTNLASPSLSVQWTHLLPRFLRGPQAAGHRLGGWRDVNYWPTFLKPPPSLPIPL